MCQLGKGEHFHECSCVQTAGGRVGRRGGGTIFLGRGVVQSPAAARRSTRESMLVKFGEEEVRAKTVLPAHRFSTRRCRYRRDRPRTISPEGLCSVSCCLAMESGLGEGVYIAVLPDVQVQECTRSPSAFVMEVETPVGSRRRRLNSESRFLRIGSGLAGGRGFAIVLGTVCRAMCLA